MDDTRGQDFSHNEIDENSVINDVMHTKTLIMQRELPCASNNIKKIGYVFDRSSLKLGQQQITH